MSSSPHPSQHPYSMVLSALCKMKLIHFSLEFRLPTNGSMLPYGTASDAILTLTETCLFKTQDSALSFQDTDKPTILPPHLFLPIFYNYLRQLFHIATHPRHIPMPLEMVLRINLKVNLSPAASSSCTLPEAPSSSISTFSFITFWF
jgi:hypothetical protein